MSAQPPQATIPAASDDDLDPDLLTPEERAAIEAGAAEDEERAALQRLVDAGDDDDEPEEAAAGGEAAAPAPAPAPAPSPSPAPAADPPAAAPVAAPVAEAPSPPPPAPAPSKAASAVYSAALPADIEQQQKQISDELGTLRDRFKAGEVEVDDYESQRDTLLGKREDLNKAIIKAEISQEMQQQDVQQAWQSAIERTFDNAAKPEGGGVDYRTDKTKAADLDLFVRRLGEDPANADKDMDWFLNEGHRRVLALHGISRVAAAPTPAPAPAAVPTRKPPVAAVPATLAQVPGSDGPGDVAGEFADLDALEGEALEDALSRLSPGQLEKYQRGR